MYEWVTNVKFKNVKHLKGLHFSRFHEAGSFKSWISCVVSPLKMFMVWMNASHRMMNINPCQTGPLFVRRRFQLNCRKKAEFINWHDILFSRTKTPSCQCVISFSVTGVNFCLLAFLLSRGHKMQKSQVSGAPVSPLLFFIYLPVCLFEGSVCTVSFEKQITNQIRSNFKQVQTLVTHPSYWVWLLLDFSVKGWESMMTHPNLYLHNDTDHSRGPSAQHLLWYWAIVFPCWNDWHRWCYRRGAQTDCIKIIAVSAHLRGLHHKYRHVCVAQKSNCQYNKEVKEPYVCLLHW